MRVVHACQAPRQAQSGAGTELHKLLSHFGLLETKDCKCAEHVQEMNRRGVEWCAENVDTIVGWLKEEARKRRLPFLDLPARILVKRAIRNARFGISEPE